MGVPLNWTQSSGTVSTAFRSIGDYVRPGWIQDLAYLLERGIKVTLAYGDRDYACNWIGGEALSLAIHYTDSEGFRSAGYAPIQANSTYVGGLVRQYGNLSFSRVFQAGHEIPSYQPETSYRIFMRALFNKDISTGVEDTYTDGVAYSSEGPSDTWGFRNEIPPPYVQYCTLLDIYATCFDDQIESIADGTALIRNWILVNENSTMLFPEVVGNGTSPANVTTGGGYGGSASTSALPPMQTGNGGSSVRPNSAFAAGLAVGLAALF